MDEPLDPGIQGKTGDPDHATDVRRMEPFVGGREVADGPQMEDPVHPSFEEGGKAFRVREIDKTNTQGGSRLRLAYPGLCC